MESIILNGKNVADCIEKEIQKEVDFLYRKSNTKPKLITLMIGDNPSSVTYVNMKIKACERVGIESEKIVLKEDTTTEEVIEQIKKLNSSNSVSGIMIQHPLPKHIDERKCFEAIDPNKDVDGLTSYNFGKMSLELSSFSPATPQAIMEILNFYNIDVATKHVVVVGRSAIVGKPVAMLLLNSNATVTVCHSKTKNLESILKTAHIVVAAVGKSKFIKKEWLKPGVVIIDAGYNKGNVGDVDLENCKDIASSYTPVPGGVGPVTIAVLLKNVLKAFNKS